MNPTEYDRMFEAEERQWWYAGMRDIALSLFDPALPPDAGRRRLLDAGCGTGGMLLHLRGRGRAVGVDLSPAALRHSRRRGLEVARASLATLPFQDGAFDAVTCLDVLYHRWVGDDLAAARELFRVLRPGGLVLLRVPALRWLWGAHDEAVHSRHRYTRPEVEALLEQAGFRPRRVTYCNTLLLPIVAARRRLDRLTGRHGSDVAFLPAPLEWLFRQLLRAEGAVVRRVSLPLGSSVVALAERPLPAAG